MRKQAFLCAVIFLAANATGLSQSGAVADPKAATTNNASVDTAGANAGTKVSVILQPALQDVEHTVGSLNTGRWKARSDVKGSTDRYLASIQRDLEETLPNLVTQADAKAGSIPPLFAVYRNVDALYDVLLRVDQIAMTAAPENEVSALESALEHLESARKQLGDEIAASAQDREAQIVRLQTAITAAAAAAPAAPAKPSIVDDGPANTPPPVKKKKKRKSATPAAPAPAASGSGTTPPSTN